MTVDHVRFPENIEQRARGGPRFATSIFTTTSGAEHRNSNAPRAVGRWTVSLGYRDTDTEDNDFDAVVAMFYNCQGRLRGFLFKDWLDYSATNQVLVPVDGEVNTFQLYKVYDNGVRTYSRKITRPKENSLILYDNGVMIPAISVDHTKGWVVPSSGTEETLTASFEFYVPVRFDRDELDLEVFIRNIKNVPTIDLMEILE